MRRKIVWARTDNEASHLGRWGVHWGRRWRIGGLGSGWGHPTLDGSDEAFLALQDHGLHLGDAVGFHRVQRRLEASGDLTRTATLPSATGVSWMPRVCEGAMWGCRDTVCPVLQPQQCVPFRSSGANPESRPKLDYTADLNPVPDPVCT